MAAEPQKAPKPNASQPDLILGTAGHIDHGKSTLIKALTGTDPDRLDEEKRRGITIELGFAQLKLPDGRTMGVVDVPGHEHFVRQMIAGATGVDVALLTIAADDGIMPQTVEHLAVLETLGISSLVVALTKTDLVDDEWIRFMSGEIRTFLSNTPYANAAIVPVSARTGFGLDELKFAIADACSHAVRNKPGAFVRLPIDRVFTIKGSGTVITGTLWSGTVHAGDEVEVLPSGEKCRVRSIQVHGAPVDEISSGNRVALNLAGVQKSEVRPGDFIATPGSVVATDRFDALLEYNDGTGKARPLESGTRMHIAHGTREVLGRVLLEEGDGNIADGQRRLAQIRLEEPLPISRGDRFIVRTYSPVHVAGGGIVLFAHPRHSTVLTESEKTMLGALRDDDLPGAFVAFVEGQQAPIALADAARAFDMAAEEARTLADDAISAGKLVAISGAEQEYVATAKTRQRLVTAIGHALVRHAADNPSSPGVGKEALRHECAPHVAPACFDALLDEAAKQGLAVVEGGEACHPGAVGTSASAVQEAGEKLLALLKSAGMTPPATSELATQAGIDLALARRALATLEKDGKACRLSSELYFDADAIACCKAAIAAHLEAGGDGTVASLKEAMGTSRKYAVPLLEHFDAAGFTVRDGDRRRLRRTN